MKSIEIVHFRSIIMVIINISRIMTSIDFSIKGNCKSEMIQFLIGSLCKIFVKLITVEMAVIRSDFSMWIPLIFFVIYISSGDAQTNGIDLEFFDFEQFKHEIFLTNRSTEFADQNLPPNDQACLDELKEVGNGLMETKLWALKRKQICFFVIRI